DNKDNAYLSQKLAQIVTDLDIELELEDAKIDKFDPKVVQALFRDLEFRALMPRLSTVMQLLGMETAQSGDQINMFANVGTGIKKPKNEDAETIIVNTPEGLEQMVRELNAAQVIAFDTETTSVNKMEADLVGISLAVEPKKGYYIPVGHNPGMGKQLDLQVVLDAIRDAMTSPKIAKAGHNIKYDYVMLARYGLEVLPLSFDSMIAEWLINPNSRNLGLKSLSWVRLDVEMTEISELIGKGKKQITMAEVEVEKAAPYAVADAEIVLRLMPELQQELQDRDAVELFDNLEMPLIRILAGMEMEGISLDADFLKKMSGELATRMGEIRSKVYMVVGWEFNLNSTQQLSEALFDRLKLIPPEGTRKTASGNYSTAAEVLDGIKDQHEIIEWILENRELSKLQSTYVEALQAQVNSHTSRVHTSYNQTGSVTGRLASSNPNLQNIPIRTELGRKVRQAFIASPEYLLLAVDYSQIELRVVAHMAGDEAMLAAFSTGQDIHSTTAAAIYAVTLEEVTEDHRRHAKAINFGLIYGMSPFGLTRTSDLTLAEAENFVEAYFDQFPGVKSFLDEVKKDAAKSGYVETLLGRRRYFHNLSNSSNQIVKNREEREAINSPIQGTAADIMKLAMLALDKALKESNVRAKMLLQVHDEIVLECHKDDIDKTAKIVQDNMAGAYKLKVPLQTDAKAGINWGKMAPTNEKS
ncbi:MAG: DNA polymerase I, partial [Chloroflexota bacterium]